MPEPLIPGAEPVGGNPIGESGMPIGAQPAAEPAEPDVEEPASEEEFEDVDFEDLKSVPPQFQKIAKKLQGSYTKKMQALSGIEQLRADAPPATPPAPADPSKEEAKQRVVEYMVSPEGSALKEIFESVVNDKLGTLPQEVMAQKVDREVGQVIAKYGEEQINSNYDAIEEMAKANPNVPLDYIVSNILFDKAKELGANEYKSKITRKSEFSNSPKGSTSNVIARKDADSFGEAFENAASTLGY